MEQAKRKSRKSKPSHRVEIYSDENYEHDKKTGFRTLPKTNNPINLQITLY